MRTTYTRTLGTVFAIAIAALFVVSSLSPAQTLPPAPREASAAWTTSSAGQNTVKVKWAAAAANVPVKYVVYFAKGVLQSADPASSWKQLRITGDLSTVFELSALGLDAATTVSFRIRSLQVTDRGDSLLSEGSAFAVAGWNGGTDNPLKFTSTPVEKATVNTEYEYHATATSTEANAVITYALYSGPDGMKIDATTGVVTWTPTRAGSYTVIITATDAAGHVVKQAYTIVVSGGTEPYGVVHGVVTDSASGEGIVGAEVDFFPVSNGAIGKAIATKTGTRGAYDIRLSPGTYRVKASATGHSARYWENEMYADYAKLLVVVDSGNYTVNIALPAEAHGTIAGIVEDRATGARLGGVKITVIAKGTSTNYGKQYVTETNADGHYEIAVPEGTYIVHGEKSGYRAAWSDSAEEVAGARLVTVTLNAQAQANIALGAAATGDFCVISGQVTGANGFLANAKIVITAIGKDGTGATGYTVSLLTNREGRYTASVPCGAAYTVYAGAEGYVAEYFEHKRSPLDANPVKVVGPTTVNFNLMTKERTGVTLAGVVYACDSTLRTIPGKVIAYRIGENSLDAVSTVYTDSLGSYSFANVDTGVYLLQASPRSLDFAPSYYTDDKTCATDWHNATRVVVKAANSQQQLNIYCKKVSTRRGFARLRGRVREIVPGPSDTYLAAGIVFAFDANGDVAGYAATDTSGSFDIENIDVGTYTLMVDKVQYGTLSQASLTTDYDANNAPIGEITATKQSVSGVNDAPTVVPTALTLGQNYPNPFNPTTEITYAIPQSGMVTLAVYAVTGQRVALLANGVQQAGTYHVTFDASNLPSGTYVYRLETAGGVVAKRMVELK